MAILLGPLGLEKLGLGFWLARATRAREARARAEYRILGPHIFSTYGIESLPVASWLAVCLDACMHCPHHWNYDIYGAVS